MRRWCVSATAISNFHDGITFIPISVRDNKREFGFYSLDVYRGWPSDRWHFGCAWRRVQGPRGNAMTCTMMLIVLFRPTLMRNTLVALGRLPSAVIGRDLRIPPPKTPLDRDCKIYDVLCAVKLSFGGNFYNRIVLRRSCRRPCANFYNVVVVLYADQYLRTAASMSDKKYWQAALWIM